MPGALLVFSMLTERCRVETMRLRCINPCAPEPEDEAVLEGIFHRVTDREIKKRGL